MKAAGNILSLVAAAYPAFKPESREMTIKGYAMAFADSGLSAPDILVGARWLIAGRSEYAPSAAAIIKAAREAKEEADTKAYYESWERIIEESERGLIPAREKEEMDEATKERLAKIEEKIDLFYERMGWDGFEKRLSKDESGE